MWSLRKHSMCQWCLLGRTFNATLLKNVFCSSEYCYFIVVLIYVFLLNNDIEYLFMCLWAICISSFMKWLFKFLPILSKKMCYYYQIIRIFCMWDVIPLLNTYVLQSFFPPFFSLHFHFLKMSFEELKVLLWCHWNYQLLLTRLAFPYLCRFCDQPKIFVLPQGHEDVFLCFLQDIVSFYLLCLDVLSIYFFLYYVMEGSRSFFWFRYPVFQNIC